MKKRDKMSENSNKKFCGFHAAHVVISEHNNNGECVCLQCPGVACHSCWKYKELLEESERKNQLRLERCISCLNQKQK